MTPIPRTRTPWSTPDLLAAYAAAWRDVLVTEPPRAALAILWGQASLECGRGGAACWNYNVGNVRASADEPHALLPGAYEFGATVPPGATQIPTPPGAAQPPGTVCYLPPASVQRFRAYPTLTEGCAGKLALILRRWPAAIDALRDAQDHDAATAYVAGLRGYFTGDATLYAGAVRSLARECLRGPEGQWPAEGVGAAPVGAAPDSMPPDTLPSPQWRDERPAEVPSAADVVATLAEPPRAPDSTPSVDPRDGTS